MKLGQRMAMALATMTFAGAVWPTLAAGQVADGANVAGPVSASAAGLQLANWVTASRDNGERPFIVIDKVGAEVLLFDGEGRLLGATPALVGVARGDDSTPGIGDRELSSMGPAERTTPAGRFVARIGPAKGYQQVLWVDFATSVALHPVIANNGKERRLQRLRSPSPEDNRITYGCINVPAKFFNDLVQPQFADGGGLVYILPDTKYLIEVFPAFHMFAPPASAMTASRNR